MSKADSRVNMMKSRVSSTGFDIYIEEVSFQQSRERHYSLRVLDTAGLCFDIFPDELVKLFRQ
jgi:hypothetical protein